MNEKTPSAQKKVSIGLILICNINEIGYVAIFEKRGEFSFENENLFQSLTGACQEIVRGKVEEGETEHQALCREITKGVGQEAFEFILIGGSRKFKKVHAWEEKDDYVIIFATEIEPDIIPLFRLGHQSGGLKHIPPSDVVNIVSADNFSDEVGVCDRRITAMAPNIKQALINAFAEILPHT